MAPTAWNRAIFPAWVRQAKLCTMATRLPSLNQLRAFEAAARLGSFKAAAAELHVTQAAISHQIKALEDDLGRELFHRGTRHVRLADAAMPLAEELTRAFSGISATVDALRGRKTTAPLRLSVAPFFGNRWLMPRLAGFRACHPDIEIETALSFDLVDLEEDGFDGAVRYGTGDWPGLASRRIYRDCVGPVAAPELVGDAELPMTVDALAALPQATTSQWPGDWQEWFVAAGLSPHAPVAPSVYESRALVFDAVLSGRAMAIFDVRMTALDEGRGRLVRLHPLIVERPQGIHVAFPQSRFPDPRLEAFVQWLQREADTGDLTPAPHV
jgi:LysR family glycine cleavage system transcriptional activator